MLCVPRIRRSRCHALLAHTVARSIFAGLKFNLSLSLLLMADEEGIVKRISARACPGICRVNGIFWRRGGDRLGHGGDWPFSCAASSSTCHRSVASCTLCTLFRHLRIQPAEVKQSKVLVAKSVEIAAANRLFGRKVFVCKCTLVHDKLIGRGMPSRRRRQQQSLASYHHLYLSQMNAWRSRDRHLGTHCTRPLLVALHTHRTPAQAA